MTSEDSVKIARARAAISAMPGFFTGVHPQVCEPITPVNKPILGRYLGVLEQYLQSSNSSYDQLNCRRLLGINDAAIRYLLFESLGTNSDEAVYDPYTVKLQELRELPLNWDSYGAQPPNEDSYCWAKVVLKALQEIGLNLTKILPSAEGGIGIVFSRNGKMADIECLNSGEILAAMSNRQGEPYVWQVEPAFEQIKKSLEKIRDFLSA